MKRLRIILIILAALLVAVPIAYFAQRAYRARQLAKFANDSENLTRAYNAAIDSGVRGQFYPGQFNRLFPGARNVISYYTGESGSPTWTSAIGLYGRYVFRMHVPITFDQARTNITACGSPTFFVIELPKITFRANANPYIDLNQMTTFSADTWARLVEAKGDFHILGLVLETNKPVQGFEVVWDKF